MSLYDIFVSMGFHPPDVMEVLGITGDYATALNMLISKRSNLPNSGFVCRDPSWNQPQVQNSCQSFNTSNFLGNQPNYFQIRNPHQLNQQHANSFPSFSQGNHMSSNPTPKSSNPFMPSGQAVNGSSSFQQSSFLADSNAMELDTQSLCMESENQPMSSNVGGFNRNGHPNPFNHQPSVLQPSNSQFNRDCWLKPRDEKTKRENTSQMGGNSTSFCQPPNSNCAIPFNQSHQTSHPARQPSGFFPAHSSTPFNPPPGFINPQCNSTNSQPAFPSMNPMIPPSRPPIQMPSNPSNPFSHPPVAIPSNSFASSIASVFQSPNSSSNSDDWRRATFHPPQGNHTGNNFNPFHEANTNASQLTQNPFDQSDSSQRASPNFYNHPSQTQSSISRQQRMRNRYPGVLSNPFNHRLALRNSPSNRLSRLRNFLRHASNSFGSPPEPQNPHSYLSNRPRSFLGPFSNPFSDPPMLHNSSNPHNRPRIPLGPFSNPFSDPPMPRHSSNPQNRPRSSLGSSSNVFGNPPVLQDPSNLQNRPRSSLGSSSNAFGNPPVLQNPSNPQNRPRSSLGSSSNAFGNPPVAHDPSNPQNRPNSSLGSSSNAFGNPPVLQNPFNLQNRPNSSLGPSSNPFRYSPLPRNASLNLSNPQYSFSPNSINDSASSYDEEPFEDFDEDQMAQARLSMFLVSMMGNRRDQISDEDINAIRTESYTQGLTQNTECSICLEEFKEKESVKILNCSHSFHTGCITRWLKSKPLCPLCRTRVINDL